MEEVVFINEKNYCDYLNLHVAAFSFAYGGAQGSGGEIIVITKESHIYRMNYAFSNMRIEMCYEVCPPLKDCIFGTFNVKKTPDGWKGVNLGAGNFLVLEDSLYDLTEHVLLKYPPYMRYGMWMGMVVYLLMSEKNERKII